MSISFSDLFSAKCTIQRAKHIRQKCATIFRCSKNPHAFIICFIYGTFNFVGLFDIRNLLLSRHVAENWIKILEYLVLYVYSITKKYVFDYSIVFWSSFCSKIRTFCNLLLIRASTFLTTCSYSCRVDTMALPVGPQSLIYVYFSL